MKANESKFSTTEYIDTGISALNGLLGGGIALGCITEFFGVPSVGKSTLAQQIITQAQKQKRPCLFSDTEFQFTQRYAESLGVDCAELDLTQNRIAEETFDAIEDWITKNKGGLVVLDSMGGVLPKEEAEKSAEGKSIGLQSRLMAAFCRKAIGLLAENNNALIIVNHEVLNLNTGAIGSSGGAKLAHHKRYSIRLKPQYGKQSNRAVDGSKRNKFIEAELKKEKGSDTSEGKKVELLYEKGRGFINSEEITQVKRGRPKTIKE